MSLGFRNLGQLGLGGAATFSPQALFANSEQGVWFDPSDLSTVFQGNSGATPGAVGSPVGLHLDKSKGLALGPELYNTATVTPGLNGSATAASYNSATGVGSITAVDGSNYSFLTFTGLTAGWYKISYTNNGPGNFLNIRDGGPGGTVWGGANSGETKTEYIRLTGTALCCRLAVSGTATFTVFSLRSIAGNHRYQTTAASRPILRQSGALYYIEYDGVDDFLVTNAVDFSASDKVTAWAGVRKLSDAATAVFVELSAAASGNAGSFLMQAPGGGLTTEPYIFASRGSSSLSYASAVSGSANAPNTSVITGIGDISGDSSIIRRNGAQVGSNASDQGTGNLGSAYPLYFGRRGGTTLPFNGYEYGLIIRGGASDAAAITRTEAWLNAKTGAY